MRSTTRFSSRSSFCFWQAGLLTRLLSLSFWAVAATLTLATEVLVPIGSVWKYLDNGTDQGSAWRAAGFNDSSWASGPAELGYGDGDEATVVSYGPTANNKYVTTYFRHAFSVVNAAGFSALTLRVRRDDGVVVYLNGAEVFRNNLPGGAITYTTLASSAVGGSDETALYQSSLDPALLLEGMNMLAAEVHQVSANSSDISFALELTATRPPITVAQLSPPDGSTGVAMPAVLTASATDPQGDNLTVTFYGRPAGPPPGPDFTIIALPDTQYYVSSLNGGSPAIFNTQIDWIVANKTARNIVFVTQLGDCVENGDNSGNDIEWRNATNALYRLEDPLTTVLTFGLPYGVAVGNHDQSPIGNPDGTTTFYNQYFGEAHFAGRPYYGGHHGSNNDNHYELFSASGMGFIVVHLEYDTSPDQAVLDWANGLLQTHANRRAIVVSHWLINSGNPGSFSTQGQATYDALKVNPNLFLMLCGHVVPNGEGQRTDIFNGTAVHSLLSDYQDRVQGGTGWLRIMEFSPSNNVIRVKTYSPWLNQYETDANSEFTLNYDMRPPGPAFELIQSNPGVPSGTMTSATWTGLSSSTDYEWFVVASDGIDSATSAIWGFRTLENAPPTVTLTGPPDGAVFPTVPAEILIEANAGDSDGAVMKVEFFANATKLGEDTQSPFDFLWSGVPEGAYTLTAVAHDNQVAQTTSAAVNLTVGGPPPAPSGLSATAQSTSEILLAWTDNSGNETGFEVYQSLDGVNFSSIGTVGPNVTGVLVNGLQPATTYYYLVRAFNGAGYSDNSNIAGAATQTPAPMTVTFTSVAADDGYLLESSENSNLGGSVAAGDSGVTALRAGDNNKDRQYKAIVAFDTASIPDGATILSATLRLKRGRVSGTNPFQTHGACYVDIKSGSGFNGATALTAEDFQAPADATQVASLSNASADGQWSEGVLNGAGLSFVNPTGTTQLRIYFALDDNDDAGTDFIGWYAGDNGTPGNRPQLVVVFQ